MFYTVYEIKDFRILCQVGPVFSVPLLISRQSN